MSALRGAASPLPQSAGGARAQNTPRQQMESQDTEAGRVDSTLRACDHEVGGWSQRETRILPADWSDSIHKHRDTGHGVCCCPAITEPGLAARACPIHTRTPKWRANNSNIIIINVHVCRNISTPERQAQNLSTTQAHHLVGCLAYNTVPTDACGLLSQRPVCDASSAVMDTRLKPNMDHQLRGGRGLGSLHHCHTPQGRGVLTLC